jgi:hypothetical protein
MVLASYRYPVARGNRECFRSRDDYIVSRINARNAELCQVMQHAANVLRDKAGRPPGKASGWVGFPWLTMVFGSGALELHDRRGLAARAFADEVERLIGDQRMPWEDTAEGEAPSTNARNFALALVRDRMGDAPERADGQMVKESVYPVELVAAKLVYVAYLLTYFFHSVRAGMGAPTSRWDYNEVATLTAESHGTGALAEGLADRVIALMWEIDDLLGGGDGSTADDPNPNTKAPVSIQRSVSLLLREIIADLEATGRYQQRELHSYHLRLITEVAWYFLTLGTPIYPGWTDLLLALMLEEGARSDRSFRSARPRYPDLRDLPKLVAGVYEPATKTSWDMTIARLQSGGGDVSSADWSEIDVDKGRTRVNLYWAAAEVLWAQAQACQGIPKHQGPLPPTAAFVTSFDLELDMALLATARGRKFRVALPVHLIHQIDKESAQAELCWLIADVVPGSQNLDPGDLTALRSPVNWRLLTSEFDPAELRSTPIVIHLSGCPLFSLPEPGNPAGRGAFRQILVDLGEAPAKQDQGQGDQERSQDDSDAEQHRKHGFVHAVTVDEYLALRQSEAELIWSSWDPRNSGARRNRALPQDLMINGLDNPRFWISMGVPVGDAAIRHRLISQLTRQRIVALGSPDRTSAPSGPEMLLGNDLDLYGPVVESPDAASQPPLSMDSGGAVGVAVNTRIGDDETSLLYWVGFDVVQADCNGFIHDLRHYVRHLADSGPNKQPSLTQQCPLAGG